MAKKEEKKERPVDKIDLGSGMLNRAAEFFKGRRGTIDAAVEEATGSKEKRKKK